MKSLHHCTGFFIPGISTILPSFALEQSGFINIPANYSSPFFAINNLLLSGWTFNLIKKILEVYNHLTNQDVLRQP
jgi:hypothetical protein